jgi:hypothetical protein
MSAVADAMMDAADGQPGQGAVPAAIAKAARFLVDLKSGKVADRGDDKIGAANPAAPARADQIATGRPTSQRIAAAHAAAQRALGMTGAAPAAAPAAAATPTVERQEPRLATAAPSSAPVTAARQAVAQPTAPAARTASPASPAAAPTARHATAPAARPSVPATQPAAPAVRAPLSVQQYLRELQFQASGHNQSEVRQALVDVTPGEVERVSRVVAKLRGRYLAQVLELGQTVHKPVPEGEIKQLRAHREMYEEAARGLDYLKDAIEKGDIGLNGVIM